MALDRLLDPEDMWRALQDLHSLCVQDFTVLYLPQSRPVDGACPVKCCQIQLDRLPKPQRNQHIQCCVRWEMAHRLCRLQSEVHYCYFCFEWVVGEKWDIHCQLHLDSLTSKRCGTITSCHILVRPGYCPFCMADPDLPASKRLESWTRDRKLWVHMREQHAAEYSWPRPCPHPLCGECVKDFAMFQFHLVDAHGLTRPGAAATQLAVDSHVDPGPDDETPSKAHSSRKRKKAGDASLLEWMPHSTFPDTKAAQADFSPVRPSKRSRQDTLTVCPSVLSLDNSGSEQSNHGGDGPFICSPSPFGQKNRDVSVEAAMIEPISPNENAAVDVVETANSEDSSGFDSLFDLYLRSPSASPVPSIKGNESSDTIPTIMEHILLSSDEEISGDMDRGRAGTCGEQAPTNSVIVPRIRLRVRQPAITLSIKVPKQDEHGKKSSSKRLHGVNNKQRTGKNRANPRTKQRQGKMRRT